MHGKVKGEHEMEVMSAGGSRDEDSVNGRVAWRVTCLKQGKSEKEYD